jgi:hypothetical protein
MVIVLNMGIDTLLYYGVNLDELKTDQPNV